MIVDDAGRRRYTGDESVLYRDSTIRNRNRRLMVFALVENIFSAEGIIFFNSIRIQFEQV